MAVACILIAACSLASDDTSLEAAAPGAKAVSTATAPAGWWVLDQPELDADRYLITEVSEASPLVVSDVFGSSERLDDLLKHSLVLMRPSVDLPIVPPPGDFERVHIGADHGDGALYRVGGATVLRWMSATSTTFVLIGRGIDDDAVVAVAASVREGEEPASAQLTRLPQGMELQFSTDHFNDSPPGVKATVGSTAWYTTPTGARVAVSATGGDDRAYTAAVLGTGAQAADVVAVQGDERAVIAPSIGMEPGSTAIWRTSTDLVTVVAAGSSRDRIRDLAAAARQVGREQFEVLTVEGRTPAPGALASGATDLGRWSVTYEGDGLFAYELTDRRGEVSAGAFGAPPGLRHPTVVTATVLPVGGSIDLVVGHVDRRADSVEVEVEHAPPVRASVQDVDEALPYRLFFAEVPTGAYQRALAIGGDEVLGSTD